MSFHSSGLSDCVDKLEDTKKNTDEVLGSLQVMMADIRDEFKAELQRVEGEFCFKLQEQDHKIAVLTSENKNLSKRLGKAIRCIELLDDKRRTMGVRLDHLCQLGGLSLKWEYLIQHRLNDLESESDITADRVKTGEEVLEATNETVRSQYP